MAVFGLFCAAVIFSFVNQRSQGVVGIVLMTVGASAVWFSRALAQAQLKLAERPYIPSHWKEVRPLTFMLWGTGVFIVGLANVFIW